MPIKTFPQALQEVLKISEADFKKIDRVDEKGAKEHGDRTPEQKLDLILEKLGAKESKRGVGMGLDPEKIAKRKIGALNLIEDESAEGGQGYVGALGCTLKDLYGGCGFGTADAFYKALGYVGAGFNPADYIKERSAGEKLQKAKLQNEIDDYVRGNYFDEKGGGLGKQEKLKQIKDSYKAITSPVANKEEYKYEIGRTTKTAKWAVKILSVPKEVMKFSIEPLKAIKKVADSDLPALPSYDDMKKRSEYEGLAKAWVVPTVLAWPFSTLPVKAVACATLLAVSGLAVGLGLALGVVTAPIWGPAKAISKWSEYKQKKINDQIANQNKKSGLSDNKLVEWATSRDGHEEKATLTLDQIIAQRDALLNKSGKSDNKSRNRFVEDDATCSPIIKKNRDEILNCLNQESAGVKDTRNPPFTGHKKILEKALELEYRSRNENKLPKKPDGSYTEDAKKELEAIKEEFKLELISKQKICNQQGKEKNLPNNPTVASIVGLDLDTNNHPKKPDKDGFFLIKIAGIYKGGPVDIYNREFDTIGLVSRTRPNAIQVGDFVKVKANTLEDAVAKIRNEGIKSATGDISICKKNKDSIFDSSKRVGIEQRLVDRDINPAMMQRNKKDEYELYNFSKPGQSLSEGKSTGRGAA